LTFDPGDFAMWAPFEAGRGRFGSSSATSAWRTRCRTASAALPNSRPGRCPQIAVGAADLQCARVAVL